MKRFLFVAAAFLVVLSACKSLDSIPSSIGLGVVTVVTGDGATPHMTSPTAFFVDAVNFPIPNSAVNPDTCNEFPYSGTSHLPPLPQIDAGQPVVVATTLDTAQLLPTPADTDGYIFYRLATNNGIRIVPGTTSRVTVPGASNGFDAFNFTFTNADSLKIDPIHASADSTHDLPLTWNPQNGQHASVVLQLEFGPTLAGINEQIYCQFTDNGAHSVQASLANAFRRAPAKRVQAYRVLTTFNNDGSEEVVVISTYATDSTTLVP